MKGVALLLLFVTILAIIFFISSKDRCLISFDCQWKITNCCPETAGAEWKCVNVKSFNETKCPGFVICPQYLSPRPDLSCACEDGKCVII